VVLACAECTLFCTQGSRVRPASGIPCALFIEEGDVITKPGRETRRSDENPYLEGFLREPNYDRQ
jgi:hypothetical protein